MRKAREAGYNKIEGREVGWEISLQKFVLVLAQLHGTKADRDVSTGQADLSIGALRYHADDLQAWEGRNTISYRYNLFTCLSTTPRCSACR
jgi:hypothetical protein